MRTLISRIRGRFTSKQVLNKGRVCMLCYVFIFYFRRDIYSLYALNLRNNLLPIHTNTQSSQSTGNQSPATGNQSPVTGHQSPKTGNESRKTGNESLETGNTSQESNMNVFGHVKVPEGCVFYKSKLSYAFVNLRLKLTILS